MMQVFKAVDGTEFEDQELCESYELQLLSKLKQNFTNNIKNKIELDYFRKIYDSIYVIKINNEEDVKNVMNLICIINEQNIRFKNYEDVINSEKINKIHKKITDALESNDYLIIGSKGSIHYYVNESEDTYSECPKYKFICLLSEFKNDINKLLTF